MRTLLITSLLVGLAAPALAQETSLDRADLDAAAGRALFQPTPLFQSIAVTEAAPAAPPAAAGQPAGSPARRPVRVVYPGPYGARP
ncbi:hypothetical protein [uncultured Enterovirga sp.]|uniref:hypothetical protein n=1 Tax=uncultured Enterovirga sp. TaxID=2026352 RepID=UPI0035C95F84